MPRRPTANPGHSVSTVEQINEVPLEVDELPDLSGDQYEAAIALEPIRRAGKDMITAVTQMTHGQARYAVDMYYQVQGNRMRARNQERASTKSDEPNDFTGWVSAQMQTVEQTIKLALDKDTDKQPVGAWAKRITGIGPVICAGLLANLDEVPPPTVGHWWRYAGLDPSLEWLGAARAREMVKDVCGDRGPVTPEHVAECAARTHRRAERLMALATDPTTGTFTRENLRATLARRPWNASLKVLCWKAGESFVKVKSSPSDVYGRIYAARKVFEIRRNEAHEYSAQAEMWRQRVGDSTIAKGFYDKGMLPPGHIHSRSKRYAVKLFLSHWHTVAYWHHFQQLPPRPYALDHLGHSTLIVPPHMDSFPGLREALTGWVAQRDMVNQYAALDFGDL